MCPQKIVLWLVAIRYRLRETTDEAQREMLRAMYVEFLRRAEG